MNKSLPWYLDEIHFHIHSSSTCTCDLWSCQIFFLSMFRNFYLCPAWWLGFLVFSFVRNWHSSHRHRMAVESAKRNWLRSRWWMCESDFPAMFARSFSSSRVLPWSTVRRHTISHVVLTYILLSAANKQLTTVYRHRRRLRNLGRGSSLGHVANANQPWPRVCCRCIIYRHRWRRYWPYCPLTPQVNIG